jgi:transposase
MSRLAILPDPDRLHLISMSADTDAITLTVCTTPGAACCPQCGVLSDRIHSRYARTLADLPWQGIPVRVRLRVRRFFCDTSACARRIFTERLPGVVAPYARRTERLTMWFTHVAFAEGGRAGARLLRLLQAVTSRDTLLRHIRGFAFADRPTPRVLSIDDFALRRGRTYGSILVDLERHCLVDLLPDRSAATFAAWLAEHSGIEVISRDRSAEYADGARQGAPAAVQVADRFHLVKNFGEVALRVLSRHASLVQQVPAPEAIGSMPSPPRSDRAASRDRTRAAMQERFDAVHALVAQGTTISATARALGLHRHTVQKYRALAAAPERRHRTRVTHILTPYAGYLLERWKAGCHNARALWREIGARGYSGGYQTVARFVASLRAQERAGTSIPSSPPGLTPRRAVGLLLARPERRTAQEQDTVTLLPGLHPDIAGTIALLDRFTDLIRNRDPEHARERLDGWMADAERSSIPELVAFVTKLRQDADAVLAGLVLPFSQGQTEGRVNKLKLIKRSMYGRANFDLLRQRARYAAAG